MQSRLNYLYAFIQLSSELECRIGGSASLLICVLFSQWARDESVTLFNIHIPEACCGFLPTVSHRPYTHRLTLVSSWHHFLFPTCLSLNPSVCLGSPSPFNTRVPPCKSPINPKDLSGVGAFLGTESRPQCRDKMKIT